MPATPVGDAPGHKNIPEYPSPQSSVNSSTLNEVLNKIYESTDFSNPAEPTYVTFVSEVNTVDDNIASQAGFKQISAHVSAINKLLGTDTECICPKADKASNDSTASSWADIAGRREPMAQKCPTLAGCKLALLGSGYGDAGIDPTPNERGSYVSFAFSASRETVAKVGNILWMKPSLKDDGSPIFPIKQVHDRIPFIKIPSKPAYKTQKHLLLGIYNPQHRDHLGDAPADLDDRAQKSLRIDLPYADRNLSEESLFLLANTAISIHLSGKRGPSGETKTIGIKDVWSIIPGSFTSISSLSYFCKVKVPAAEIKSLGQKKFHAAFFHQDGGNNEAGKVRCRFTNPPPQSHIRRIVVGVSPNPNGDDFINAKLSEFQPVPPEVKSPPAGNTVTPPIPPNPSPPAATMGEDNGTADNQGTPPIPVASAPIARANPMLVPVSNSSTTAETPQDAAPTTTPTLSAIAEASPPPPPAGDKSGVGREPTPPTDQADVSPPTPPASQNQDEDQPAATMTANVSSVAPEPAMSVMTETPIPTPASSHGDDADWVPVRSGLQSPTKGQKNSPPPRTIPTSGDSASSDSTHPIPNETIIPSPFLRNSFSALVGSSDDTPPLADSDAEDDTPSPDVSTPSASIRPPTLPSREYPQPTVLFPQPTDDSTPTLQTPSSPAHQTPEPAPALPSPLPPRYPFDPYNQPHRKPVRNRSLPSTPQPSSKSRLGGPGGH